MSELPPLGAILAGGASRRMGEDKALVDLAGRPMIAYVASALESGGCRVTAIGRSDHPAGVASVDDSPSGRRGPVAGLATALRIAGGAPVVLVGVDQPFLRASTVERLLSLTGGDAVVPVAGGSRQATCAVFWPNCDAIVADLLGGSSDPSLQAVLDRVPLREVTDDEWRQWGEDGDSWWSVDTPEALTVARGRLA